MRKPEAVIFDMDGVLIDSEPIHIEIENKLYAKLGINVSEEVHRSYLGASNEYMYTDLKSRYQLGQTVTELMAFDEDFRSDYFRNLDHLSANEGVICLLQEIIAAGIKLAVATSSPPDIVNILLKIFGSN